MLIFPAIDLYEGKAVRLFKGDYSQMTVYSDYPEQIACDFALCGAKYLHLVDLEGAKSGNTPNLECIKKIVNASKLFTEIGGGIRSISTAEKYFEIGVNRVILGTAAVTDEAFLTEAIAKYGDKIAVGADIKDGFVAIKGWTEKSGYSCDGFIAKMQSMGVKNIICTDISRDGAMKGTNREMYKSLASRYSVQITASGGVSTLEDVRQLSEMKLYAAIIGKAYYTGSINLKEAIEVAK